MKNSIQNTQKLNSRPCSRYPIDGKKKLTIAGMTWLCGCSGAAGDVTFTTMFCGCCWNGCCGYGCWKGLCCCGCCGATGACVTKIGATGTAGGNVWAGLRSTISTLGGSWCAIGPGTVTVEEHLGQGNDFPILDSGAFRLTPHSPQLNLSMMVGPIVESQKHKNRCSIPISLKSIYNTEQSAVLVTRRTAFGLPCVNRNQPSVNPSYSDTIRVVEICSCAVRSRDTHILARPPPIQKTTLKVRPLRRGSVSMACVF